MLYGNNIKNKTGDVDPFDKKKLAEEAKKDKEKQEAAQRLQDRNKIQLQINNLSRELDRLVMDLRTKENNLATARRKSDDAKRNIYLLEGKMKKEEGGVSYLSSEASAHSEKAAVLELEAEKTKNRINVIANERAVLESKYNNDKINLIDLDTKISHLKIELDKVTAEADLLRKGVDKVQNEINIKKSEESRLAQTSKNLEIGSRQKFFDKTMVTKNIQAEKKQLKQGEQDLFFFKRQAEQFEKDYLVVNQDVNRLNRDKIAKEKEIADLKRQKDTINV